MHYELGVNQTHHLVEPSIITGSSIAQNYAMEIYPNPVSDELNLKTSAGTNSVTLRDQLGQRIHAVSVTKTNTGCKLNLENLESGVYFLMVEQSGISKVFKVIRL